MVGMPQIWGANADGLGVAIFLPRIQSEGCFLRWRPLSPQHP